MSVRVRYSTAVKVSSDSNTESKDLGNLSFESVTDSLGEGGTRKFTLPASATNVSLAMGNVASASFVFLKTNAKNPLQTPSLIKLRLNSPTGEEISVSPLALTGQGQFLLTASTITALYATNPSTTVDMEITLVVAGD